MNRPVTPYLVIAALLFSASALAADGNTIYLDETVISGNQELPRVLYIVPWREPHGEAVPALPPAVKTKRILEPIYPEEYRQELQFRALARNLKQATTKDMQQP